MVIERIKLRDIASVSIDKVHCCYFDEGNLQVRIDAKDLEGAVRRGRGGKEKEWTDCVQSDIRAFGIAGGLESDGVKS